ncbi:MAG: hypothetical protein LBR29_00350 [Methylobacteriaceae bacterium]|jgi:hypothetical protein|nr:hypothetical protein [Methylobacteriaceae bacterium]
MRNALLLFICPAMMAAAGAGSAAAEEQTAPQQAAEPEQRLFFVSPTAGTYFPSSAKVRHAFGNAWTGFGVSPNLESVWDGFRFGHFRLYPYGDIQWAKKHDNSAYIIPVGAELRYFINGYETFRPYVGVDVAAYGVKFKIPAAGIDTGWKAAVGGRVFVGLDITQWFTLQGSYTAVTNVEGYNFGGFEVYGKLRIRF